MPFEGTPENPMSRTTMNQGLIGEVAVAKSKAYALKKGVPTVLTIVALPLLAYAMGWTISPRDITETVIFNPDIPVLNTTESFVNILLTETYQAPIGKLGGIAVLAVALWGSLYFGGKWASGGYTSKTGTK